MPNVEQEILETALERNWSGEPGEKVKHGITQKAFCESIGMSTRHLAAVKSSELRNRYYHELGAMKLACLWVLERFTDDTLE